VAALLDDVQRQAVDVDARPTGYGASPVEIEPGPFLSADDSGQGELPL